MLDKKKFNKKSFHTYIETSNNIKINKEITDELYDIIGYWCKFDNEVVYVLGLSMDKFDYYYVILDNDMKLKYITCLYSLRNTLDTQIWTDYEKKLIEQYITKTILFSQDKLLTPISFGL